MIEKIKEFFKKLSWLYFFSETREFEGYANIVEIPDVNYGFLGHKTKRKGKQKGLGVEDISGKIRYGIPFIVKPKDTNLETREKKVNLDNLVREASKGSKIYIKGKIRVRSDFTKCMLPPFDGPFCLEMGLHMPIYEGIIEIDGNPTYKFYVDWYEPFKTHTLKRI